MRADISRLIYIYIIFVWLYNLREISRIPYLTGGHSLTFDELLSKTELDSRSYNMKMRLKIHTVNNNNKKKRNSKCGREKMI